MARAPDGPPACPCGSGRAYTDCCAPYIAGKSLPVTAEALMRSRYSAYTMGNEAYLLATWHPDTRPASLGLATEPQPRWLGLTVKAHTLVDANRASVEFVARYKINGRAYRLHEISRFERLADRWVYRDGSFQD